MDFILPPDLAQAKATISLDANTASFSSPTVGSTRSIERLGDRLRINFDFTITNDNTNTARQRGRMQSFLSKLRGQASRVWMSPPGQALRGSFPAPELVVNNTFANGTASFTGASTATLPALTASDRVLRVTVTDGSSVGWTAYQSIAVTLNSMYVGRAAFLPGTLTGSIMQARIDQALVQALGNAVSSGLSRVAAVADTTPMNLVAWVPNLNFIAGNFFEVAYMSFSRCALVDNAANMLTYSDQLDNVAWGKANSTVTANSAVAPDGTATADALLETATTAQHVISQASSTTTSAPSDMCLTVAVKFAAIRTNCMILMQEATGGSNAFAFFNVSTGVVGTTGVGANWSNLRTSSLNLGNGWFQITLIAKKTSASTVTTAYLYNASADNVSSYLGTPSAYVYFWRATLSQSSVPQQLALSTTPTIPTGTPQTGTVIAVKALPVSTAGLLLPGDWIESNAQLNHVISPLNSDANGCGFLQLARPFRNSPADNAPVIINNPMGKFLVNSNTTAWNEQPGSISDATIEFIEDISF